MAPFSRAEWQLRQDIKRSRCGKFISCSQRQRERERRRGGLGAGKRPLQRWCPLLSSRNPHIKIFSCQSAHSKRESQANRPKSTQRRTPDVAANKDNSAVKRARVQSVCLPLSLSLYRSLLLQSSFATYKSLKKYRNQNTEGQRQQQ